MQGGASLGLRKMNLLVLLTGETHDQSLEPYEMPLF